MQSTLPQLKLQRASDSIIQILRDGITGRLFLPGQRLDVKDLARKLDVSLTPVKDALNRLAADGLIEIRPRRGTFVADLTPEEVAETFEIRAALECLAAEKAMDRLTPQVLDRFRALIADLEKPVSSEKEGIAHEQKNVEFHNLLVELSGNRKLMEMYRSLKAHIQIVRIHYFSRDGWVKRTEKDEKAEHREILEALAGRDKERLIRALRHHIQRASQCLVDDLKKERDLQAAEPGRP